MKDIFSIRMICWTHEAFTNKEMKVFFFNLNKLEKLYKNVKNCIIHIIHKQNTKWISISILTVIRSVATCRMMILKSNENNRKQLSKFLSFFSFVETRGPRSTTHNSQGRQDSRREEEMKVDMDNENRWNWNLKIIEKNYLKNIPVPTPNEMHAQTKSTLTLLNMPFDNVINHSKFQKKFVLR